MITKFNDYNIHFQVFGSESSQDLDCMVFVDSIPSVAESHELCEQYGRMIKEITKTNKEVNTNLCVVENGVVKEVFKGTEDEVNNSLYLTYDKHKQWCPIKIERMVNRDVDLKILRTCRVLLSFWSRSEMRPEIKKALRGDIYQKIKTIKDFDITKYKDLGKNVNWEDYIKVIAFQLGQTIGLIDGIELYSKESICEHYPKLCPYLGRNTSAPLDILEEYKDLFVSRIEDREFSITKEVLKK